MKTALFKGFLRVFFYHSAMNRYMFAYVSSRLPTFYFYITLSVRFLAMKKVRKENHICTLLPCSSINLLTESRSSGKTLSQYLF